MKEYIFAFPNGNSHREYSGMTLRDYFAAQAMSTIIADVIMGDTPDNLAAKEIANKCYEIADAMYAAREE